MFNTNKLLLYIISFMALFTLWHLLSFLIGSEVLPPPLPVISAFFSELSDSNFWVNTFSSLYRILGGLGLAFITAIPLGLILILSLTYFKKPKPQSLILTPSNVSIQKS